MAALTAAAGFKYDADAVPLNAPWLGCFTITPNDAADLTPNSARGLYSSGAGTVRVLLFAATDDTQTHDLVFAAGEIKPVCVRRVFLSGTTGGLTIKGGW